MLGFLRVFLMVAAVLAAGRICAAEKVQAETKATESLKVTVCVPGDDGVATNVYDLAAAAAKDDVKSAKDYVDAYAANVQYDKKFKEHEK